MIMKHDVFGIGNAIMDLFVQVSPNELIELDLKKGQFQLIDQEQSKKILEKVKKMDIKTTRAGSSANVLYNIALLGGKVVFCGKVGNDEHGDIYEQEFTRENSRSAISRADDYQTGHAITFITPDAERTFAVHLGAAIKLEKIDVFYDDLKQSKILHVEGYQMEDPKLKEVVLAAMQFARMHDVKVSIDLNDAGIVERNRKDIRMFIRNYAHIVFANEEEAKALTEKDTEDALKDLADMTEIAVVKIGKRGSYIKKGDETYTIKPFTAKAIDTTGAGDMYAAGFLYGLTHGYTLKQCGNISSFLAAKVVEQIGGRLESIDKKEIEKIKNI